MVIFVKICSDVFRLQITDNRNGIRKICNLISVDPVEIAQGAYFKLGSEEGILSEEDTSAKAFNINFNKQKNGRKFITI